MNKLILCFAVVVLLAGCGTSVPLTDTVPVSDAKVKPVELSGRDVSNAGAGVQSSGVASVDLGSSLPAVNSKDAGPISENRVVYFDYDSFTIKPEYQALISEHAAAIKTRPSRKVAIEGHTDETGGREYNVALGQRRADAVVGALTVLGVSASQLEAVSFGKEKPAAAGADEAAYSKNRRAEIRY